MKKILLPMFVLIGCLCFSQTVTKKYNSIDRRYEYFDSNGNMTGYEFYNNLSRQWEYYSLNNSQQRKPYQYRDPMQVDISSTLNAQTILQNRYNNNRQKLQAAIDDINNQIDGLNVSKETKQSISEGFRNTLVKYLDAILSQMNSDTQTNNNIIWLYNAAKQITQNHLD
ncbi:hypothetical protein HZP71_18015 [Elizabethkingia anophelis]|nr:hypothetical protein [Elizabethkingia anophelis]